MSLAFAIKAAETYAKEEGNVVMVSARSVDFAERWFIVEGVRKGYHRFYVVDRCSMLLARVVEVINGVQMDADKMIDFATEAKGTLIPLI